MDLSWITDISQNWQSSLASLIVGIIVSWITKHVLVDHPKAVSLVVSIMETLEGTVKQVLGERWAPVYDALLKAGEAAMDGNVTADEAYDIATSAFETAIKVTGVQLSADEKNVMLGILKFVITALMSNRAASRSAVKSVRVSLKARGIA